eukprot:758330-Hanusia_phi.AAC.2
MDLEQLDEGVPAFASRDKSDSIFWLILTISFDKREHRAARGRNRDTTASDGMHRQCPKMTRHSESPCGGCTSSEV